MQSLEDAILRTVLYADIFDFALTIPELHYFLIHDKSVSQATIEAALQQSPRLRQYLCVEQGYIVLIQRPELISLRQAKERLIQQLEAKARRYGYILALIPFVRMVALTGALAARNPKDEHDDFDYLLITEPGRVWLARGLAILIVRVGRLFGVRICPNYVLAKDQLEQNKRDLFMAREIAQMSPIVGSTLHQEMLKANLWASHYLPNIHSPAHTIPSAQSLNGLGRLFQRAGELLLWGRLADALEKWEYSRKKDKFARQQHLHSSAEIDSHRVKGHFYDHGRQILALYQDRLKAYGLDQ